MRRFIPCFFALLLASGQSYLTHAQQVTPGPATTPSTTPSTESSPWADDIHQLDYNLAESGYQVNPTRANRNRLLQTAERLINKFCIPGISPGYRESYKKVGSYCDTFTSKIVTLDPGNPAALCARMGPDSQDCSQAYRSIGVTILKPNDEAYSEKDLEIFVDAEKQSFDSQVEESRLVELMREYTLNKKQEVRDKILTIFYDQLKKNCAVTRYDVSPPTPAITPTPTPQAGGKPFDQLLSELNKKNSSKVLQPENMPRRRLVSHACLKFIERLKNFDPQHYLYVCYSEGFFSPNCIRSQKQQRSQVKDKNAPLAADAIEGF